MRGFCVFMRSLPTMTSGPSPLIRKIFSEHVANFGEPDQSYRFDSRNTRDEILALDVLDVMVWRPTDDCEMTTFSSIGMAERAMIGAKHRAEIHFAYRGKLSPKDESQLASFVANVAVYPFYNKLCLDWWHTILHSSIPLFPKCSSILFHRAFVKDGWETIDFEGQCVHLLNVVPITQQELELKRKSLDTLLDHFEENNVDIFRDRQT